jgi:hypothetical protein
LVLVLHDNARMKRKILLTFSISAAVSCGTSGGSGGGLTADQACGDLAMARCTRIESCSATVFAIRYPDQPTCQAREKANCMKSVAAPSTGNSPQATEACATALQGNVTCSEFLDNTPPAACAAKFGTLANGTACAFSGQCQSSYCGVGPNALCGTCMASPPAAGASCTDLFCGPGLECATESKTCGTPAAMSAPCDAAPCAPGLVCAGAMGSRTCQMIASTAAAGQACGNLAGNHVVCAAQGFCKLPAGQTTAMCLGVAGDGAACDDVMGPICAIPARCVNGTCQLPDAANCH